MMMRSGRIPPVRVAKRTLSFFPVTFFVFIVTLVCFGLGISAWNTHRSLTDISTQYLERQGENLLISLDMQYRRSRNRAGPKVWQGMLEENYAVHQGSVAFLALVDGNGNQQAFAGRANEIDEWIPGRMTSSPPLLYMFEEELPTSLTAPSDRDPENHWKFRAALEAAPAVATVRLATLHLLVAGIAVVTLFGLAFYSVWVLRRFVQLQARESSERHLASLGRMAATLAHEIRNPLGAVKGLTQVAREQLPVDHRAQSLMESVVKEARRLENLVTDLLSFARPRQAEFKDFNLTDLLRDIRRMLEPQLLRQDCRLAIQDDLELLVQSDEAGLRQVILNVLLNALEASPRGGTVSVLTRLDSENGSVVLSVEDEGPGLGGLDPDELFEPFASNKLHGTGLGLAISRRILENLSGTIKLEDRRPREGAVCTILIPTKPP